MKDETLENIVGVLGLIVMSALLFLIFVEVDVDFGRKWLDIEFQLKGSQKLVLPECYLTDTRNCVKGYDIAVYGWCESPLNECCRRPHYLLQGIYNGYTCYGILGINRAHDWMV